MSVPIDQLLVSLSPVGLLADLLIIAASPMPPRVSMTEAVSSPSNLGTLCGWSTGTSVDPCIVRPIKKESPKRVTTCLHKSYVITFQSRPQNRSRTLRFRLPSAQIGGSASRAIGYVACPQWSMGPVQSKRKRMDPLGRWLAVWNNFNFLHHLEADIIPLCTDIDHPDPFEQCTRSLIPILQRIIVIIDPSFRCTIR
jgi:hypothetical protein